MLFVLSCCSWSTLWTTGQRQAFLPVSCFFFFHFKRITSSISLSVVLVVFLMFCSSFSIGEFRVQYRCISYLLLIGQYRCISYVLSIVQYRCILSIVQYRCISYVLSVVQCRCLSYTCFIHRSVSVYFVCFSPLVQYWCISYVFSMVQCRCTSHVVRSQIHGKLYFRKIVKSKHNLQWIGNGPDTMKR